MNVIAQHRLYTGIRQWRKLIHSLIEIKCLFGPFSDYLYNPQRVCYLLLLFYLSDQWLYNSGLNDYVYE